MPLNYPTTFEMLQDKGLNIKRLSVKTLHRGALQVYRPFLLYQLEKPAQAFYGLGRYLSGLQQNALSV